MNCTEESVPGEQSPDLKKTIIDVQDCDICGQNHATESCLQISNSIIVKDAEAPSRAILTLPNNLRIRYSSPKEALARKLPTVTAREKILKGTQFGPVEAPFTSQPPQNVDFPLKIVNQDGSSTFLDTSCKENCNWMSMVLAAETLELQNLIAYQVNQSIYYRAIRDIRFHEELRVWYAPYYAKKIGIVKDLPSTGEVVDKPRKYKSKTTIATNLENKVDLTSGDKTSNELTSNNPYQLRVRQHGRKRKIYEDFVNDDDDDISENEGGETVHEWNCSHCGITCRSQVLFAKHLLQHLNSDKEENTPKSYSPAENKLAYTCHFCHESFSDVYNIQQHYMENHQEIFVIDQPENESNCDAENNISDADAATILLEIEANCDKNEEQSVNSMQLLISEDKCINSTIEKSMIPNGDVDDNTIQVMEANIKKFDYLCDICKRKLPDKENLLMHLNKHIEESEEDFRLEEEEHVCVFCQKVFSSKRSLNLHVDRHTGTHACIECGKSYPTKEALKSHECSSTKSPDENTVSCQVCQKTFTKLKYLEKHMPVHTGNNACSICGKWLRSADSLLNHMRICGQLTKDLNEDGYAVCHLCKETFSDLKDYRQHMFQHRHAFSCESCGARFRNKISLVNHVCNDISNLECDICNIKFENVASLNDHRSTSHSQSPFKCNSCQETFNEQGLLESHDCPAGRRRRGRKTKNLPLLPIVCETCGASFSSTSSLNTHSRLHGDKLFACDVCGKRFHRKDLMLDHWAVHGEAAIPCPLCSKKFKTKKSLDVHLSLHDGVKRYTCDTCGKQFYQKGNLIKHAEVHNPCRKYACELCPKSFSTKEYLAIHLLGHTKGRTFACDICGKTFIKDHQLKAHQKMFHANVSFTCAFCSLSVKFKHSLKRHLRKKHMDKQDHWRSPQQIDAMMVPCETNYNEKIEEEKQEELMLTVSGIGSETLQQALVSGAARIQHGSAPNTIEITLPVQEKDAAVQGIEDLCSSQDQSSIANTHIIHLPYATDTQGEKMECDDRNEVTLEVEEECEAQQFQVTLSADVDEMGTEITLDKEDQQILDAGGEIVLVNGAIIRQETIDAENKVFFYVVDAPDTGDTLTQPQL